MTLLIPLPILSSRLTWPPATFVTSSWNACFSWLPGQCPPWEDLNGFSSTCSFFLDFQILGCPRTHFSSPFILTSVVILSGLRTWNITYKLESPRFLSLTQISALIPDTCIQLPHLHLHWIDTSKITGPHLTSHLPYTIASLTVFLSGLMVTNCSGWKYNLQCLFFFFFSIYISSWLGNSGGSFLRHTKNVKIIAICTAITKPTLSFTF